MPRVITAQRRKQLLRRKQLIALVRYFYTGEWEIPASPLLRPARLSWLSTAKPGTILANAN